MRIIIIKWHTEIGDAVRLSPTSAGPCPDKVIHYQIRNENTFDNYKILTPSQSSNFDFSWLLVNYPASSPCLTINPDEIPSPYKSHIPCRLSPIFFYKIHSTLKPKVSQHHGKTPHTSVYKTQEHKPRFCVQHSLSLKFAHTSLKKFSAIYTQRPK